MPFLCGLLPCLLPLEYLLVGGLCAESCEPLSKSLSSSGRGEPGLSRGAWQEPGRMVEAVLRAVGVTQAVLRWFPGCGVAEGRGAGCEQ